MNMASTAMAALAALSGLLLFAVWRYKPVFVRAPGPSARPAAMADWPAWCWWVWICFVLSGVLISAMVSILDGHPSDSTIRYAARLLLPPAGTDSWGLMLHASSFMREHPGAPLYQTLFFEEHAKFQYPVTSLVLIDIPRSLFHASAGSVILALQLFSRLCAIAIGVVFALLLNNAAASSMGSDSRAGVPVRRLPLSLLVMVGVISTMLFYPISRSETLGQIQTAMTLAAALAMLAWQSGRPRLAGLLLGLCCVVKPHWIIVVVWALLRRQWGFAKAATAVVAVFVALAVAMYGLDNVLGYVPVVSYIGKHGESFYANQSVNGLVNRWLFNGSNAVFSNAFAPYHPVVHAATVATSALILGFALFWGRTRQPSVLGLASIMLALTIASPIAWEHHYGILLPIFAVLLPAAAARRPFGSLTLPCLWVAFVLTSQSFTYATGLLADSRWNVLQSYLFAGALLLLVCLWRMTWLERQGPVEAGGYRSST